MSEDLYIPKLGQTVDEVVLIDWLVKDGDRVEFGDPVLEVETDKAIFNVEANANGYIHFGASKIGETVRVLTVVATIGNKDEGFSQYSTVAKGTEEPTIALAKKTPATMEKPVQEIADGEQAKRKKFFTSPRARKLADDRGVDISQLTPTGGEGVRVVELDVIDYLKGQPRTTPLAAAMAEDYGQDLQDIIGSGPKGIITRKDVERVMRQSLSGAPTAVDVPASDIKYADISIKESQPLSTIRKLIFNRMAISDLMTARVTLVTEADATELVQLREKLGAVKAEKWGFKPGFNDLIGVIVAQTLKEFPHLNARLSQNGANIEILAEINLGIAMDTNRGLVVPVIKNADQMDLRSFGARFREVVENTQKGQISPENLSGGTFTITNLGGFDVDAFTPIINLPEVAILGLGRIQDKVVPYKGEVKIRKMITLSLGFDHRLIDGAPAARFLQKIREYIEYPVILFV